MKDWKVLSTKEDDRHLNFVLNANSSSKTILSNNICDILQCRYHDETHRHCTDCDSVNCGKEVCSHVDRLVETTEHSAARRPGLAERRDCEGGLDAAEFWDKSNDLASIKVTFKVALVQNLIWVSRYKAY